MLKQAGYTLVEILVVLFIISIVTSVALLSIRSNADKQIESFANTLSELVKLAEEQAMLQPNVMGLSLDKHIFQFSSLQLQENGKLQWFASKDSVLHQQNIPDNMQVSLEIQGSRMDFNDTSKNNPQIIISTNGDITPFTIFLGKVGEKPRYAIIGEADGSIHTTTV